MQAVGAVATAIGGEQRTSLLEIATHVPLDVESIARIVDSLADEGILEVEEADNGLKWYHVADPKAYAEQAELVAEGEHLDEGFVQNLVALRADHDWCRKVRDQHQVIRAVASAEATLDIERLNAIVDIPPARIRAVIGDFEAESCVKTDSTEDSMSIVFPLLQYPPERFETNTELLSHVETRPAPIHRVWWVILGVAAAVLVLFIASRLAMG